MREVHRQAWRRSVGQKLLEEAHQLFRAWHRNDPKGVLSEAADLLDMILRALSFYGFNSTDLLRVREEKSRSSRGFEREVVRERVHEAASNPGREDFPRLLFIPVDHVTLIHLIKALLVQSQRVSIVSAFYTPAITNLLLNDLTLLTERGGVLRILLSTMGNLNRPEHLEHIPRFVPGAQVRIFHPEGVPLEETPPNFHAKAYLFERGPAQGSMIIGSSNFTQGGFLSNVEWNYYSSAEVNLPFDGVHSPFDQALKEFDRLWNEESVELTETFLRAYRQRYRPVPESLWIASAQADFTARPKLRPNAAQRDALERLAALRAEGVKRAAVVAATGLGKTHLAAFDCKNSGFQRVLFIAHRENLLRHAREIFAQVLGDKDFGVIIGGGQHADRPLNAAFAMIQTLSRPEHLAQFPRDHFEYIVIDEFHHAAAKSYERVLGYFQPRFLLGLTATPERSDGRDVLALCGYNIAYEVRLLDAVDRGWLTPFQYYAIKDPTDYEQISWRGTHYDERELEQALSNDTRMAILVHNLRKYLPYSGKIKALAFCSSIAHAKYAARVLSETYGIASAFLVGEHAADERQSLITRLQNEEDPLQVICCVDVFNEGIDIPKLSHVLLLRPTQSFSLFLQQIGRGLRRAEGKDFVVVIDFVGNYRKAHVAPLALMGYRSLEEAANDCRKVSPSVRTMTLPAACFLDADLEAERIWNREIRLIFDTMPRRERLRAWYQEVCEGLEGKSPQLMDFWGAGGGIDPKVFILEFGGWLRAKLYCEGALPDEEKRLLNTPGEAFLRHVEMELKPTRSYKMAVLRVLLNLPGTSWAVDVIAKGFLNFYLKNREMLFDYDDLAKVPNPDKYPHRRVRSHLLNMPLKYLSNTEKDWFLLSDDRQIFRLKDEIVTFWNDPFFKRLVLDRVNFELALYFQRRRLQQTVYYDPSLLEWGFLLEPSFAERFFLRRQNGMEILAALEPGEKRSVRLTYGDKTFRVLVERSKFLRQHQLVYAQVQELIDMISNRFTPPPRKGQKVFVLKRKDSQHLVQLDAQD